MARRRLKMTKEAIRRRAAYRAKKGRGKGRGRGRAKARRGRRSARGGRGRGAGFWEDVGNFVTENVLPTLATVAPLLL